MAENNLIKKENLVELPFDGVGLGLNVGRIIPGNNGLSSSSYSGVGAFFQTHFLSCGMKSSPYWQN